VFIFSPDIFRHITSRKKTDIEKDVLPQIGQKKYNIYAYNTSEYLKDMGTPERLERVRMDYATGKI
jgi:NDP-sugar pyrophosphorylase family protein